jgi:hypothetical protein
VTVWVAFYEVVRFEFCHFEERWRREILMLVKIDRFLPSVEMTKMAVIQSSQDMDDPEEAFPAGNHSDIRIDQAPA